METILTIAIRIIAGIVVIAFLIIIGALKAASHSDDITTPIYEAEIQKKDREPQPKTYHRD